VPDPRAVTPVDAQAGRGLDPFSDPNHPLSRRSVFFDFDSYVVKSEFQPVVETHGKFLGSNRDRRIVIEGHTDERGGREYNLALGQRRAEAVKQSAVAARAPPMRRSKRSASARKSRARPARTRKPGRRTGGLTSSIASRFRASCTGRVPCEVWLR
jgi:peptidoglycan-associated lipoprotein